MKTILSVISILLLASVNLFGQTPEIDIKGRNISITSGDATPTKEDNTFFGNKYVSGETSSLTFTIYNTGTGNLTLSGNPKVNITSGSSDFTVTTQPTSPVLPNGSTSFTIVFDPSTSGTRNGTVSISNNDANEGTYTFSISGVGTTTNLVRWVNNQGATRPATVTLNGVTYNTHTTAYTDIQTAINAAATDDMVYITDGLYRNPNEASSTSCLFSGTGQQFNLYLTIENKSITLTSETGNHCNSDARLVGYGIFLDNANNTIIQGLHLDSVRVNAFWNTNDATSSPYFQSNNVQILRNKITNTNGHGIKTDTGGPTGIPSNRGAWDIIGNYFENIGFYNGRGNCSAQPVTAMWLGEAGNSFVIADNIINNTKWAGILCDGYGGYEQMGGGSNAAGAVTISGNRINNTVDAAIQIGFTSGTPGFYSLNAYITQNTITNANTSHSASSAAICILSSNVKGKNITYNDISSSFNGVSICIAGWESASAANFTYINNNNFYSLSGGYGITHIAGIAPNGTYGTADNLAYYSFENNYWGASNGPNYTTNPSGSGVGLRKETIAIGGLVYSVNDFDFIPYSTTANSVSSASLSCCQAPSASISYPLATYCVSSSPVNVNRTGTPTGTYSASPAGLSLNGDNGQISPASSSPGTYTITYIIGQATNCILTTTTTIVTITSNPSATIAYPVASYCTNGANASINRIGSSGGIYSVSPSGLSINTSTGEINPSASTANNYTVTYSIAATGSCSSFSTNTNLNIINPPASPTLSASTNSPCAGTQVLLTANPPSGLTAVEYLWSKNGTAVNYQNGGTGTYLVNAGNTSGTVNYAVQMIYSGNICLSSASATTSLNVSAPTATITPTGSTTFCANTPTTLNANAGMSNYLWRRGGTIVGTNANAYIPTLSGNHNVTVTDANGCTKSTAWTAISIKPIPTANAGADKNLCVGSSVQIGANSLASNTYTWSPATALNNAYIANPITNTPATTTYSLTVNNTTTGCSNTDNVVLTSLSVPPMPTITAITLGNSVTLTANSPNAVSINWYKNGAGFYANMLPNSSITVLATNPTNAYTLKSKGANGCLSATSTAINVRIGEEKGGDMLIHTESMMQVYPNPITDILNINLKNIAEREGILFLYNSLGQIVFSKKISLINGSANEILDLYGLAAGIYTLTFQTDSNKYIEKVVKE